MRIDEIESYCVHLPNRMDREKNMKIELDGFTSNWKVFGAIKKSPGYIGVSESFKSIVRSAKERGLKQVLIFEDDIKFTSVNSKEQFQKCIDSLPNDWDILLGGIYSLVDLNDLNNESINCCIKRIGDFSALHCTLINESAYDMVLRHNPYDKYTHLDRWVGYLSANDRLKVYVSYPMVAIQNTTYSESGPARVEVNYDRMLDKFDLFR